jgi:hypothetical protein
MKKLKYIPESLVIIFALLTCNVDQVLARDISFLPTAMNSPELSDSKADTLITGSGKHVLPKALARLENNPHDTLALTYITNILEDPRQSVYDFPGVALALCRHWDSFSPEVIAAIKSDLERLANPDAIGGEGFLGNSTESANTLMWCSGYLFAQLFPDANWANGMPSGELMAEMKERLRKTFKNIYRNGYAEYLSTTNEVIMNFPVEILLEYAEDPEMKAIAEAYLLYKWSLSSLNNFQGNVLAPYARMNYQENHLPDSEIAATTYYNWLLWGWGPATNNVKFIDYLIYQETSYSIYTALSNIIPEDIFFEMADSISTPQTILSSSSSFGEYGTGVPNMMMRKAYRDVSYAIGTGNFRWVPGGNYYDHEINGFSIAWNSPDRFNYIGCFHPFWYSDGDDPDRTPDTWYKGNISPFQQTAHHKNTVITLFDIPDEDPWPEKPTSERWAWRDGHANELIKRAMLHYPESIDEKLEENGWIFLRERITYIGIKPLKDYYEQTDLTGLGLDGFNIIKSDYAQTGFIIELGTENESGSFKAFRETLAANKISVNWGDSLAVSYINSRKDSIHIQYQPGLKEVVDDNLPKHLTDSGINGIAESIPIVTINGEPDLSYEEWPMIKSPIVNMDSSILDIDDGKVKISVNWQDEYPAITTNFHSIQVEFIDSISGEPFKSLEAIIDGELYITDDQGVISFPKIFDGSYNVDLPNFRYEITGNNIIEFNSDTLIQIFVKKKPSLTIQVVNRTTGSSIYRAVVTIDSIFYNSNSSGFVLTEKYSSGPYVVSVSANDYFSIPDTVVYNLDTPVILSLTPKRASVTFSFSDINGPLSGVKVTLSGSQYTNTSGEAYFFSQLARENYTWSAEKAGYNTLQDSFHLETDTTLQITMDLGTMVQKKSGDNHLLVYPNPAHDYLVIAREIPVANLVKIGLVNVLGVSMYSAQEATLPYTLRLKGINPGIYFLKITFPEGFANQTIVVK